jgi:Formyl transferase
MRTVLICHHDEPLNRFGLSRWLASFSDLVAVIDLHEPPGRLFRRVRREMKRTGFLHFLDVLAFRLYYRLALAKRDHEWTERRLSELRAQYPEIPPTCRVLVTPSPNSPECLSLLHELQPDIIIARCKSILKKDIFRSASTGTFVMHPGICPEYRNAHGCFWALAENDLKNVGMTLLRIDKGIDTGPVYGYFSYPYDECAESHIVIQHRTVFDNLDQIRDKLLEIEKGIATPLDTSERKSGNWGQPWLTRYLRWKRAARKRAGEYEPNIAALP